MEGVGVVMEYGFGGFFGELALRTSAPRAATVRAKGFSSTVLELPRSAFEWLMKQKGDVKALIEEAGSSYKSFDVEESAGPKGNAALSEEEIRKKCEDQALEIHHLKTENTELMKEIESLRQQVATQNGSAGVAAQPGDDELDGET